jgi:SAM-dependent methyltransferase
MVSIGHNDCPCCKKKNGKPLYVLSCGPVYQCAGCKTAYTVFDGHDVIGKTNEIFASTDVIKARLYDQYSLRKIARNRLGLLGDFIDGGSVLEFGSFTGEFLYECAKSGYEASSVDLHPRILNMNKTKNLKEIIRSDAVFFKSERNYDAIAAFHVIEHLTDPAEFIANCRKALKPGGILFLEVPNFGSLARRAMGKRWSMFHDYHVCHFDKNSLKDLIERSGYEILAVRTTDDPGRYVAPVYNPPRRRFWSMMKKVMREKANSTGRNNITRDTDGAYSLADEIRILNSNKARIYRLEQGLIRAVSKLFLPISMVLDMCFLGSSLQMIARKAGK